MCGIFGSINKNALRDTYTGLQRLEYRGYDSFGYAALKNGEVSVERQLGPLVEEVFISNDSDYEAVVGHVRWATNGEVCIENAHPQFNEHFYVVHNGIVENAPTNILDTRWLIGLLAYYKGDLKTVYDKIEGDNAFIFINKLDGNIHCVAKGTKRLFVSINGYVSSDLSALAGFCRNAYVLEEGYCTVNCIPLEKEIVSVPLPQKKLLIKKSKMLTEILEQQNFSIQKYTCDIPLMSHNVDIIATGSSFHAGMFGAYALEQSLGIPVRCIHASQSRHRLLQEYAITISQSGETKDVINATQKLKNFICITNNPQSTLGQKSSATIPLGVGLEEAVAATKTFTMSCIKLCQTANIKLEDISEAIENLIVRSAEIKSIAQRISGYDHFLFLGDRQNYPIALEGALKFKEVAYLHAEGMPSAEMKHGPIALVDYKVPSLFLMTKELSRESLSNIQEIKCRNGVVIVITHEEVESKFDHLADIVFSCKDVNEPYSQSLVLNVVLQLLSYYIALERGLNPDRPRNLAKSVTV